MYTGSYLTESERDHFDCCRMLSATDPKSRRNKNALVRTVCDSRRRNHPTDLPDKERKNPQDTEPNTRHASAAWISDVACVELARDKDAPTCE